MFYWTYFAGTSGQSNIKEIKPFMKYQIQLLNLFLIVAAVTLWSGFQSPVLAEKDYPPGSERFKEKFDTDGDGIISEEEKENVRAHLRERFGAGGPGKRGPGMGRDGMLEKFDADGDGTLSEEEKEEAHSFFQERRKQFMAERLEKFDTDGDGKLSQEERTAARGQGGEFKRPGDNADRAARRNQQRIKRFDTDGDGKLSEEERKAARASRTRKGGDQK